MPVKPAAKLKCEWCGANAESLPPYKFQSYIGGTPETRYWVECSNCLSRYCCNDSGPIKIRKEFNPSMPHATPEQAARIKALSKYKITYKDVAQCAGLSSHKVSNFNKNSPCCASWCVCALASVWW